MAISIHHRHLTKGSGGKEVLVVPGVLSRSHEQAGPLFPVFAEMGYAVSTIDYVSVWFDADMVIRDLMEIVDPYMNGETRLALFGSSLGGMLVAEVLARLGEEYGSVRVSERISAIIVDAPADGADLVLAPGVPPAFNKLAGWVLRRFSPSERANASYGAKILKSFAVPPKNDEIEYPPSLSEAGRRAHAEGIKAQAMKYLSGHDFTVWVDQIRWMLNTELDLEPLRMAEVAYLACTANNVTLHQPQALEKWHPFVRRLNEVSTPHCAYLQAQPTWSAQVRECLQALED